MNKDPAFLFYSSDFLVGTMLMNYEEIGKYIKLLAYIHSKGGTITTKEFFQVCTENDTEIISKFSVDGEGNYYNERLLSEMRKRKDYTESRRNNLKGSKKDKNSDDMDSHMDVHMGNHMATHMENENEDIIINDNSLSLKENNNKVKRFLKPTIDEIRAYILDDNLNVDANTFFDYYESNGWVVGKNKMKDWKATLRNWSRKEKINKDTKGKTVLDRLKDL